jgi:hypothetical protein
MRRALAFSASVCRQASEGTSAASRPTQPALSRWARRLRPVASTQRAADRPIRPGCPEPSTGALLHDGPRQAVQTCADYLHRPALPACDLRCPRTFTSLSLSQAFLRADRLQPQTTRWDVPTRHRRYVGCPRDTRAPRHPASPPPTPSPPIVGTISACTVKSRTWVSRGNDCGWAQPSSRPAAPHAGGRAA